MTSENIPNKFRIEIYENSYVNDPTIAFYAATPFLTVSVGDHIDPTCWSHGQPDDPKKLFKVIGLRHLIINTLDTHNVHSLSVLVELTEKN